MTILNIAWQSLVNRKLTAFLTVLSIALSVALLLGVEKTRTSARSSFINSISGTDLIVGARSGSLNLLLYSVFRIGNPTNNISWQTYQQISSSRGVEWAVPISLGDSHKGYRVMGTSADYFKYFSYGQKRSLGFSQGREFQQLFDVVLGSEVAKQLDYQLGDKLVLAHGLASTSFSMHDDRPFQVVGILAPTGTPVDQTLHVSLAAIEAIHLDWQQGVKIPGRNISNEQLEAAQLQPKDITAFMLGLKSRITTFQIQREINNYRPEPLLAILPGVALSELWQMMGILEQTLKLISILVLVAALLGLSAMLLASIREREREIQLLRVIGASPLFLFLLIELEALLISLGSILLGTGLLYLCLIWVGDFLTSEFGLHISANILSPSSATLLALILLATLVAAAVPSLTAYWNARSSQS